MKASFSYKYGFDAPFLACRCIGGIRHHRGFVRIYNSRGTVAKSAFIVVYDGDYKLLSLAVANKDALRILRKDVGNVEEFIMDRFAGFLI